MFPKLKKFVQLMLRYCTLLSIPFFFTFMINYLFKFEDNKYNIPVINHSIDFYQNPLLDFNSNTIIKIYSEKFIDNSDLLEDYKINNIGYPIITKIDNQKIHKIENQNLLNLKSLESNWKKNYSQKKIEFIQTLLPLIDFENKKIISERNKILNIKNYLL
mgnify:CR=1 FL=1